MKHQLKVSLLLVLIFFLAQVIGLFVIGSYIDIEQTARSGKTVLIDNEYSAIEPIEVENESLSFLYILLPVFFGTFLIMMMIKFKMGSLWKYWFSLSVILALFVAISPFMKRFLDFLGLLNTSFYVLFFTLVICIILAYYKVFKKNLLVHNLSELFIYGGLAALFVPMLNFTSAFVLLVLISLYDMYAVWKSKHMVELAQFQTKSKIFAGVMLPYSVGASKSSKIKLVSSLDKVSLKEKSPTASNNKVKIKVNTAILGGGDMAFPLFFSGAVLKYSFNYFAAISISVFAALALLLLFVYGKKGKFYPAMPFISSGCFVGVLFSYVCLIIF